ncbi:hypothetical protein RvY_13706 [Ramazzottius varieornatus]|uniref:Uncharacterized protein n=1 Tax=Ramazzottius varieornatus TaxID=947166 RepID=A0A1D1VQZ8_RAMVA|nr:hypothetical protein RvY_13706 [Ramazzottius varieornatus]
MNELPSVMPWLARSTGSVIGARNPHEYAKRDNPPHLAMLCGPSDEDLDMDVAAMALLRPRYVCLDRGALDAIHCSEL